MWKKGCNSRQDRYAELIARLGQVCAFKVAMSVPELPVRPSARSTDSHIPPIKPGYPPLDDEQSLPKDPHHVDASHVYAFGTTFIDAFLLVFATYAGMATGAYFAFDVVLYPWEFGSVWFQAIFKEVGTTVGALLLPLRVVMGLMVICDHRYKYWLLLVLFALKAFMTWYASETLFVNFNKFHI